MASVSGRSGRFGLGRYYGPPGNRPTKPEARAIYDYWKDTVMKEAKDEVNLVVNVDVNRLKNSFLHHTDEYDGEKFVVRRGQTFDIDIELTRPYDSKKDDLWIVFQFGKDPKISKQTEFEVRLASKEGFKGWNGTVQSTKGNSINVEVTTPADCYVGKWTMKIDSVKNDGKSVIVKRYNHDDKIYILFNPWCKDDDVYLADEAKIAEYVLNETGLIYIGSGFWPKPRAWKFGQFEGGVLDCALYLLDEKSQMKDKARGNPVPVCRKISALVNEADEDGVLVGNWSGDYSGGKGPTSWTGSVAILEEFYKTKEPVRFGQCWVFSGIVTTICRTLGIPARSVTNFSSAHDTDSSITIDHYCDEKGEPIDYLNSDSVWNFHVWNDVWMRRNDLPDGKYDGWQAIDATPQETSDGVYCMGPMSLKAIKEGELHLPYDGKFVYSEVNGDRVTYRREKDGYNFNVFHVDKRYVGQSISTKRVGENRREDITQEYKHYEWSSRGKDAAETAKIHADTPEIIRYSNDDEEASDVKFSLILPSNAYVGEAIKIRLQMKNTSKDKRHVDGKILVNSIYYTGILKEYITTFTVDGLELKPGEEKELVKEVSSDDYFARLTDFCAVKITSYMHVGETGQSFGSDRDIVLQKPELTIKAPKECTAGNRVDVEVSFANPLDMTLTGCKLAVEGPGVEKSLTLSQKNVMAKGTFIGNFSTTPLKHGKREFVVVFNCDQLYSINNVHGITVKKQTE